VGVWQYKAERCLNGNAYVNLWAFGTNLTVLNAEARRGGIHIEVKEVDYSIFCVN
jgi:hypothetical protein